MRGRLLILVQCGCTFFGSHTFAATKLSGALVAGGSVASFKIAPDGSRVVYQADQEFNDVHELYSVLLDAPPSPTKLSGPASYTGVNSAFGVFQVSSDSVWVVYRAHLAADGNTIGLLSAPLDGSSPAVDLNGPLFGPFGSAPGNGDFEITPDSSRVVFSGDHGNEAYSTAVAGSQPKVPLDTANVWLYQHQVSPDSQRFVQRTGQGLFSHVLSTTSPPVRLNEPGDSVDSRFLITADGSRVVFTDNDGITHGLGGYFSAPLDGTGPITKLSDLLLHNSGTTISSPADYQLTPDGTQLIYRFDPEYDNRIELYARPVNGSQPAKLLTNPAAVGKGVQRDSFKISPTGEHIVYRADQLQTGVVEFFGYYLPSNAGPFPMHGPAVAGQSFLSMDFTPEGSHVVYYGRDVEGYQSSIYIGPVNGSSPAMQLVSNPTGPAELVASQISPDGSLMVIGVDSDGYLQPGLNVNPDPPRIDALYVVSTAGGTPRLVTEVVGDGRRILDYKISPDSRSVIYLANQDSLSAYEVFQAPLSILGDYNNDGTVNSADYTVYRNRAAGIGGTSLLYGDDTPGVGPDDFIRWKLHYGESNGGPSLFDGLANVPEPLTIILLLHVVGFAYVQRRRKYSES